MCNETSSVDIVPATSGSLRGLCGASEADDDVLRGDLQGVLMINHYVLNVA
jgi:hypothetical protein